VVEDLLQTFLLSFSLITLHIVAEFVFKTNVGTVQDHYIKHKPSACYLASNFIWVSVAIHVLAVHTVFTVSFHCAQPVRNYEKRRAYQQLDLPIDVEKNQ